MQMHPSAHYTHISVKAFLIEKSDCSRHMRTFAICKRAHSLKVSSEMRDYMRIWLWVASSVQKCVSGNCLKKKVEL